MDLSKVTVGTSRGIGRKMYIGVRRADGSFPNKREATEEILRAVAFHMEDHPEGYTHNRDKVLKLVDAGIIKPIPDITDKERETLNDIINLVDYGIQERITLFGDIDTTDFESLKNKLKM